MGASKRQKDGYWYVFIRHKGERSAHKCADEQHAEDMRKAVLTAIAAGQFDVTKLQHRREEPKEKPPTPTLAAFFDNTMSPLWKASLAAGTFSRYEVSFRLHVRPVLGDVFLRDLTREQVKDCVVSMLKKPAMKRTNSEDEPERMLSKDSIRNTIATLRAMLNEAIERKMIAANPATRLGKLYREAGSVHEQVDPFTAEEIPLLLDAVRAHFGQDNYVSALCLFHTGLRASELAGLQWPDVDFRGRFITVRRQYKDRKIKRTKTKRIRKVDISDALLEELKALKKRRQEEYLGRGKNEIPEWVFLSPGQIIWENGKPVGRAEGEPLDMKNFRNRVFLKACDRASIRRRRLHDTRHTFASILLMAGERHVYVTEQLGNSSIKLTVDIYGHWIPGSNRQAVNKLPSLMQLNVRAAAN